jgi:extracellular factor (EF) 3-hydroxypalmitic acid methyl ester biosynthesis protein
MSFAPKAHHEDFEIPEKRVDSIRSDRHELIGVRSTLEFQCGLFQVTNYSATGIAISAGMGSDFFTESESYSATHSVDGVRVGTYQLCLVRKLELPSGEGTQVAFEIKTGSVPIDRIETIIKLGRVLKGFAEIQEEMGKIPHEFRRITLETRSFLRNLEIRIEELRAEKKHCSLHELQRFESTLIPIVADFLTELFKSSYPQLEASLKEVAEADLPASVGFFREQLKELIYQSPFAHRSVAKPLGYAGDYEVMNIIYRNERVGDSLFGKCLHAYWLNHSEAKAVRNRSRYLYDILFHLIRDSAGAPLKIGSIACGPAREVQMLIKSSAEQGLDLSNCDFHLLDQDLNALKHASEKLREILKLANKPVQLNFIHKAIKNVITRGLKENNFDLLYSAGLFDYFSDPVAQMGAKALYQCLKPGGRLIIGNFNLKTPNQFGMWLALDWSLINRSPDDLIRLFGDLGGVLSIEQEPEGVNLFCVIQKPEKV